MQKGYLKIKASAKINLTLDVLGKVENGYHQISTIFQEINLFDEIIFKKLSTPGIKLIIKGPESATLKSSHELAENSILKTIKLLQGKYPQLKNIGLNITLKKNIPVAAGLGGGSSNAAATLKALNQLYHLKITNRQLQNLASKIGMDVPFFIMGGLASGSHFGEKISSIFPSSNTHKVNLSTASGASFLKNILILLPKNVQKISTQDVYQQLDEIPKPQNKQSTKALLKAIKSQGQNANLKDITQFFCNDFNLLYQKKFASLQKELFQLGATNVQLCGAGPALYAVFSTDEKLKTAYQKLKPKSKVWMSSATQL
ncbi:MAG: 4-(cytidine 5'-diphospho)-2-C-methyl-D-erythritol kinase [Candidatus Gracilibacteria bacterium]|jgi:4-diphosphocytidyl-2-C-methyl-D-erythritol kinase